LPICRILSTLRKQSRSSRQKSSQRAVKKMPEKRIKLVGNVPVPEAPTGPAPWRPGSQRHRIFLLSPANASGPRAKLILGESAHSQLAERLRNGGAPLGEVFSFISGLYFRGKLAYARAYADPPPGVPGVLVITPSRGLVWPDKVVTLEELRELSSVPVAATESRYRIPLERDARLLSAAMGEDCEAVLLGSVATPKYVEPLLCQFGARLLFPAEFAGRGEMSRGSLLLRCVREGIQLHYARVAEAERPGRRPEKPAPLPRR
jgi:hypothetical protein